MPASAPQCQVVGSMKPAAALERHEMVNDVAGAPRPSPGGARLLHHREDVRGAHRRLKLHCVTLEIAVMEFVVEAIEEKLGRKPGKTRKP